MGVDGGAGGWRATGCPRYDHEAPNGGRKAAHATIMRLTAAGEKLPTLRSSGSGWQRQFSQTPSVILYRENKWKGDNE